VVVKAREVEHQIAAGVELQRTGQGIEDVDAFVDALGFTLITTVVDMAFCSSFNPL